eukprot:g2004.t1
MLSLGITHYLCYLVGFVYPAYASFKALETKDPADDIQWLTYWVVYSIFSTIDGLFGFILGWIPLIYEAELILIAWMIAPQFKGAKVLYDNYLKPFLIKYGSKIDPVFENTKGVIESPYMGAAINLAQTYAPEIAEQAIKMAQEKAKELADQAAQSANGEDAKTK